MDKPKRNISDISHHFLSNIRGETTPKRTPPAAGSATSGLPVHAEIPNANASSQTGEPQLQEADEPMDPIGRRVTAVLGAGLNGSYFVRCREFAGHLCRDGGRIGLIQVDGGELRLHLVEHDPSPANLPPVMGRPIEGRMDPRRIREALHELDYDVEQWLLLLPDPRQPEAAALLQLVDEWTLLAAADHEGVVAGYRTLKGMVTKESPDIQLALIDAADDATAGRMFTKLDGVCRQFLDAGLARFDRVNTSATVSEHGILWLRNPLDEPGSTGRAVQWNVVKNFLTRNRAVLEEDESIPDVVEPAPEAVEDSEELIGQAEVDALQTPVTEVEEPVAQEPAAAPQQPKPVATQPPAQPTMRLAPTHVEDDSELIVDLPAGGDIVGAVLEARSDLIECKITVPGNVGQLAIRRDGRLTLVSVADDALADLQQHATALHWLQQSAALIAQALPQLAVRTDAEPVLMLLVAHRRADATALQPLVAAGKVELVPYRKVKWGERTGLLLAA